MSDVRATEVLRRHGIRRLLLPVLVAMVNVRAVHVRVDQRVVAVRVAMLADHGEIVMMIVVSVIVSMSVFVA